MQHTNIEKNIERESAEPRAARNFGDPVELFLGAGNRVTRLLREEGGSETPKNPITLDINPKSEPDVLWDLENRPLPFDGETFQEIHAYEILEHVGQQGDWRGFFEEFTEYHRILKPKGRIFGSVPALSSPWLWADPGHKRVITADTFIFLDQKAYKEVGSTPMSDYRHVYKADFKLRFSKEMGQLFWFALEKK